MPSAELSFEGETHLEHNAGWEKKLLMWDYLDLVSVGYPGWETKEPGGGHRPAPPCVRLRIKNKVDRASDEIAREWDDIAEGRFYFREASDDGCGSVGPNEYYTAFFTFQRLSDAITFRKRYGGSIE